MNNAKFYTADGFTDTLPGICAFKKQTESNLRELFRLHGYKEIETPGIEYLDIYSRPGFVPEESLYKMTDQKGRLLTLRYDGTIPAVRYAAGIKDFDPSSLPLRLCYIENMYRFAGSGGGKQNEFTQAGVELMGAEGADADAEVIALAIKSALGAGIKDLQISIGQVRLYDGIARQLGLDEQTKTEIEKAINSRDTVTIEKTCDRLNITDEGRKLLLMLPDAQGTYDIIEDFEALVKDEEAINALNNVRAILDCLDEQGYLKYVSVDAGLMGGSVDYYTGVIFKGYTYGVGFPIISGGRYDNTVEVFGRRMECVGFSLSLTLVLTALLRQGTSMLEKPVDAIVGYAEGFRQEAYAVVERLRDEGLAAILDTTGMDSDALDEYGRKLGIEQIIYVKEEEN
ncbi:MAG: ATP phosphoribosyltransferase regulatory subunit [Clostridiales bacterium]|nr:ATP phosphoribosyltransferase regulatory subunit [Clostridiales bacterium]